VVGGRFSSAAAFFLFFLANFDVVSRSGCSTSGPRESDGGRAKSAVLRRSWMGGRTVRAEAGEGKACSGAKLIG